MSKYYQTVKSLKLLYPYYREPTGLVEYIYDIIRNKLKTICNVISGIISQKQQKQTMVVLVKCYQ